MIHKGQVLNETTLNAAFMSKTENNSILGSITTPEAISVGSLSVSGTSTLTGNVGIGVASATDVLTLGLASDGLATSRKAIRLNNGGWAVPGATTNLSNGDKLVFFKSSTESYAIGVESGNMWLQSHATLKVYDSSATQKAQIALSSGNSYFMTGNTGFGTNDPGAKVDVSGSVRASSQLISTVATGTIPVAVTSSTMCTNLNANYINGIESARIVFGSNLRATTPWNTGVNNIVKSGFYYVATDQTNLPTASDYHVIHSQCDSTDGYAFQIGTAMGSNNTYLRYKASDSWAAWVKLWNSGNDGISSGLDADALDSYHLSISGTGIAWGYVPGVSADGVTEIGRYLDFHHTSADGVDYATRLHTDGTNNGRLFINSNLVWNAGNDGTGSTLDSDFVDGLHATSVNTASTVVARDANSNINVSSTTIAAKYTISYNATANSLDFTYIG